MQLVYVYVDEYCTLQQTEFNFSPEVCLSFNKEQNAVTVSDSQSNFPEEFWGESIRSLTAVVGNNGAGKTSLMQYIISLFLEVHGNMSANKRGILIFGEGNALYVYHSTAWEMRPTIVMKSQKYQHAQLLKGIAPEPLSKTKLIYLTNALNRRDSTRSQWYKSGRMTPFYDCSAGSLFVSDSENDVNQVSRSVSVDSPDLETYFLYEQYKQIKFVFDRRQHQICASLKDHGYPMPVPEKLHIELVLDHRLSSALEDDDDLILDSYSYDSFALLELDKRVFPDLYELQKGTGLKQCDPYDFLRKELSRCTIWCAVRSAAKTMSNVAKSNLRTFLLEDINCASTDYATIFQIIWNKIQEIKESKNDYNRDWIGLNSCYRYYIDFLQFLETTPIEQHFEIETDLRNLSPPCSELKSISFSVNTSDDSWFIEFVQKYRYVCNPDYFLDFSWGLSSGENSLLSLFASLYYIYGTDYTNPKNGDYKIWNQLKQGGDNQCDSVILLIDEADLTYHPEWQRVFIDILTAFLPQIYPPQCCRDIQIILTTHSPILLSDMPQQSVIYLRYDPEKRCSKVDNSRQPGTFGQNIHLLYKNSFFLEHGTIGSFARRKMDRLLGELQEIEKLIDRNRRKDPSVEEDGSKHRYLPSAETGAQDYKDSPTPDQKEEFSALLDKLEHQCRPCAELIAEPIIRRRVMTWIADLEQKLDPAMRDKWLREMTDMELKQTLDSLQSELSRRRT